MCTSFILTRPAGSSGSLTQAERKLSYLDTVALSSHSDCRLELELLVNLHRRFFLCIILFEQHIVCFSFVWKTDMYSLEASVY